MCGSRVLPNCMERENFSPLSFLALCSWVSTIETHPVYPELTSQDFLQQLCIPDLSIPGQSRVYINIVSAPLRSSSTSPLAPLPHTQLLLLQHKSLFAHATLDFKIYVHISINNSCLTFYFIK